MAAYESLRALAARQLAGERAGHTLNPTALVHEAYLRLIEQERLNGADRGVFYAAAAQAMRRILVDHARARNRLKRGGGRVRAPISVADLAREDNPETALILDDAICRLEEQAPEMARVVILRFYAGLSVEATAELLGISAPTVKRRWACARAWLFREFQGREAQA